MKEHRQHSASSSSSQPYEGLDQRWSEPEFLAIGQIKKAHGLRGEVTIEVMTDFPERFDEMKVVYVGDKVSAKLFAVAATRWHKSQVLLQFEGVTDRTQAETFKGLYLKIPVSEAKQLAPDDYYDYQLQGLAVVTDEGELLGPVVEIIETGANDVYVVSGEQAEILLPATQEVVLKVDLESRRMIVHVLDGLL